jgi:hypothetical protein
MAEEVVTEASVVNTAGAGDHIAITRKMACTVPRQTTFVGLVPSLARGQRIQVQRKEDIPGPCDRRRKGRVLARWVI